MICARECVTCARVCAVCMSARRSGRECELLREELVGRYSWIWLPRGDSDPERVYEHEVAGSDGSAVGVADTLSHSIGAVQSCMPEARGVRAPEARGEAKASVPRNMDAMDPSTVLSRLSGWISVCLATAGCKLWTGWEASRFCSAFNVGE